MIYPVDRTFKIVFKVVFVEAKTCIIFSFLLGTLAIILKPGNSYKELKIQLHNRKLQNVLVI